MFVALFETASLRQSVGYEPVEFIYARVVEPEMREKIKVGAG